MAKKQWHGPFARFAENLPKFRYAANARIGFVPKPWPGRDVRTRESNNLISGPLRLS